jgi:hypothetical protein
MSSRICSALFLLMVAGGVAAQSRELLPNPRISAPSILVTSSDVTFAVPLNLTQLPPGLRGIDVSCAIASEAFHPSGAELRAAKEVSISGGQVVTTVQVVVPVNVPADSAGKTARYSCSMRGVDSSSGVPDFLAAGHVKPAFRVAITPPEGFISGSFTW